MIAKSDISDTKQSGAEGNPLFEMIAKSDISDTFRKENQNEQGLR